MSSSPSVLFIGLDAAEPSLLKQCLDTGEMPNLAKLSRGALQGAVTNSPGIYTGSVWPSFHTGLQPGRHGRYFYRQLEQGSYRTSTFPAAKLPVAPFWSQLDRNHRKVAIIDLPKAPLVELGSGIQLCDWGTHDPDGPPISYPGSLAADIVAQFGTEPVGLCDIAMGNNAGVAGLRDKLIARVQKKTEIILQLMNAEDWDLFATAYGDSHCAGHQFWSMHDPTHPQHNPELLQILGSDPLQDVYSAIDDGLGAVLAEVEPQTTVIVMASHGMGNHYDATFLLDEILLRLEGERPDPGKGQLETLQRLWHRMPEAFRSSLMPLSDRFYDYWKGRGRGNRSCFVVPTNDNCAGIRINVAGREPNGKIGAGDEFEEFCNTLEKRLKKLVNAETGRPLVHEVLQTAKIFPGPYQHALPDILVRWDRSAPVRRVNSEDIGEVVGDYHGIRTGDHRNGGYFFARGADIVPGKLQSAVQMTDFAPSIARLLGIDLTDVDGALIPSLLG